METSVGGSGRGSPAIWQQQQQQQQQPVGPYGRQVGPPPAPQRSPGGYSPGVGGDAGSGAALRSGSIADSGGSRSGAILGDPRFDRAPSSSVGNSVHGAGMYLQADNAGAFSGPLQEAGPLDAMSAAGSGAGSSRQLRQSSSDSFGTWPHRTASDGRHHSGIPPSVRSKSLTDPRSMLLGLVLT